MLEYASGRDVTATFYATHMLGQQRAESVLERLPRIEVNTTNNGTPEDPSEGAIQGPLVFNLDGASEAESLAGSSQVFRN